MVIHDLDDLGVPPFEVPIIPIWWFPKNEATPSHHPLINGIFPYKSTGYGGTLPHHSEVSRLCEPSRPAARALQGPREARDGNL